MHPSGVSLSSPKNRIRNPAHGSFSRIVQLHYLARRRTSVRVFAASAVDGKAEEETPLSEEELIQLTKDFLEESAFSATGTGDNRGVWLAEDFVFRGPAIGPFNKEDHLKRIPATRVKTAFPDLQYRNWGFNVDPENPMRVWYFSQIQGTMTKDWEIRGRFFPATGKAIECGPEVQSVEWTTDRKVRYQSVGYCADRIYGGSPDGSMTVAVFAAFKAADQPFVVNFVMSPLYEWFEALRGTPQATPWENLPEWFQKLPGSKLKGSQGYRRV